ncbi:MAG: hypothetical protein ACPHK8_04145 [Thermoplasmatota archaeon]
MSIRIPSVTAVSSVRMRQPRFSFIAGAMVCCFLILGAMLVAATEGIPLNANFALIIGVYWLAIGLFFGLLLFLAEKNWRVVQVQGTNDQGEAGTWNFMGVGENQLDFILKFKDA